MMIEYWYDKNCLLVGDVESRDNSFDHEFGRQMARGNELRALSVIVYVGGFDYDVTEFFKDKHPDTFQLMEERFLEHMNEKYGDSVACG